jgi:hypothetical protein
MDLKPLHDQLDRLNRNLETWIGLVATLNAKPGTDAAALAATPDTPAAAPTVETGAAEPEAKRGRPRKRYFYNSTKHWAQETGSSPGPEWVEVTKTKFEEIRDKIARGELKPIGTEAPAETTPAASDDPFADDEPAATTKALTLDDVRAAAFKVRDKFGMDEARTLIGKYAAKLDQVKPEDFAKLIADCDAKIGASDL